MLYRARCSLLDAMQSHRSFASYLTPGKIPARRRDKRLMTEPTREEQLRVALAEAVQYIMGQKDVPPEVFQRWRELLDYTEDMNFHYNAVYLGAPLSKEPEEEP
jgi:hypothetical protein